MYVCVIEWKVPSAFLLPPFLFFCTYQIFKATEETPARVGSKTKQKRTKGCLLFLNLHIIYIAKVGSRYLWVGQQMLL